MQTKFFELKQYIKQYYKSQKRFAEALGVAPQQVTKWLNAGVAVAVSEDRHQLLSYKRDIPEVVTVYNAFSEHLDDMDDYPLYKKSDYTYSMPRPRITLDVRTGEINADNTTYTSSSVAEFNGLVISFDLSSNLLDKHQINDFIDENIEKFQRILSIYKEGWNGSNHIGEFINGFEDSLEIEKLKNFVSTNLIESVDYKISDLNDDIDFDHVFTSEFENFAQFQEQIVNFLDNAILIDLMEDDVIYAGLEYLFSKLENGDISKNEALVLRESGYDVGQWQEELEEAINQ